MEIKYESLFLFSNTDKDVWAFILHTSFGSHLTPTAFKFILTFRTGCYAW